MTAKELFKKIGFEESKETHGVINYIKYTPIGKERIWFSKRLHPFFTYEEMNAKNQELWYHKKVLDGDTQAAINKQLEELGWDKDKLKGAQNGR